jgi:superfamily II DNA or RNA helicase
MPVVTFVAGTLELRGLEGDEAALLTSAWRWDARSRCHRAPAMDYAELVRGFVRGGVKLDDRARAYLELERELRVKRDARPYQTEALAHWSKHGGRGVVVLPTGAGKSHVAVMAIAEKKRSTLVVAPTLDLVRQWFDLLRTSFGGDVGIVGGGEHSLHPLTVTTYDSAHLHMEHFGARFGLVVFDECHHLPGPSYQLAAELCLAPYRLGLTATPERADGREEALARLIGPVVHRKDIGELAGNFLAEYETEHVEVELDADEREEYERERALYVGFLRSQNIRMSSPQGWSDFIMRSARSAEGQRAMKAYRRQREIAFASRGKLELVEHLLHLHRTDRSLVFTQDNATAYQVARRFLIPIITHHTKVRERSQILERFADGRYSAVVTSKVLNEGVDVPDANVAIVMSGSGSVREHVQRLGRILRKRDGKRATLYELVSSGTGETRVSERRREHEAYKAGG